VEQMMKLINSYRYKKLVVARLDYARSGNVASNPIEGARSMPG